MQHAIGLGDLEQPVQHVFQDGGIAEEQLRDLAGIGFIARHILAREIEDAPHIGFFLRRHARRRAGRWRIPLRWRCRRPWPFSRQRDHRDGEGHAGIAFAVEDEMAGDGADQRAHGAADQKPAARRH